MPSRLFRRKSLLKRTTPMSPPIFIYIHSDPEPRSYPADCLLDAMVFDPKNNLCAKDLKKGACGLQKDGGASMSLFLYSFGSQYEKCCLNYPRHQESKNASFTILSREREKRTDKI
ncbi:hypothetical protein CEXT_23991 [Caerostris extrusa]|uniref:Uncharacterized protein n=1 Tax=Caerostris extrusa TaxID=172846 RepID=A0AAV4NVH0_CAEEX|nr:hypothetical protein CEXT_23991 [Caerostris extrusa]